MKTKFMFCWSRGPMIERANENEHSQLIPARAKPFRRISFRFLSILNTFSSEKGKHCSNGESEKHNHSTKWIFSSSISKKLRGTFGRMPRIGHLASMALTLAGSAAFWHLLFHAIAFRIGHVAIFGFGPNLDWPLEHSSVDRWVISSFGIYMGLCSSGFGQSGFLFFLDLVDS